MKKLFQALSVGIIFLSLFTLVACGGGGSGTTNGSGQAKPLNVAFLPKEINNPYFDTAATGGKDAASTLKGTFKQVGPSDSNAAEQVPFITTNTRER